MKFSFKNIDVTCIQLEDGIWFLGNDIARILGYKNPTKAFKDHTHENDRKRLSFKASNDSLEANTCSELWGTNDFSDKVLINESGLYCLIFGSHTEGAQEFKFWVTHDVLPSIRQHGGYIDRQEELEEASRESLFKEIEKLSGKVNDLARQNTRIKEHWHAAVAERNNLKTQKKELRLKNKFLARNYSILVQDSCEEADRSERLQTKFIEAIEERARMLREDYERRHPEVKASTSTNTRPDTSFRVDKYGFVLN